jgi:hypothetical protein
MGLLSRFGKGLKATAPLFGQMAQYSMLQEADEKKYKRLLEAEERKWGRDIKLHGMKTEAASAEAKRKAELDYYTNEKKNLIEGVKSLNATLKPFISSDGTLIPLSEDQAALRDSLLKRISTYENAINNIDLMQRGVIGIDIDTMGLEDAIMYEAIDKAILEGDALEEINQAKESMFEGIGSPLDVTDQSSFGFGGKPLSIEKDIIEDQIKALEEIISEDPIYGRTKYELKDEHKDYYRSKLGSLSRKEPEAAEEKPVTDTDDIPAKTTTRKTRLSTVTGGGTSPLQGLNVMFKNINAWFNQDFGSASGRIRQGGGKRKDRDDDSDAIINKGIAQLSESGKSFLDLYSKAIQSSEEADADTREKFDYTYLEEMFESLSDEDKKILQELDASLGMTMDSLNIPIPDVNANAFVAPSDKSIQRMVESFTDAQRIA